jgi:DNA-binding GntR family transcriptional regulator
MNVVVSGTDSIPRRSLHDELTERLRRLITHGELSPGQKIREKALCLQFGVSRTPLREALKVLASEGIVTLRPNRGAVVSALTVEELEEVFPVMGALEALSGEIACRHITDQELEAIGGTS